MSSVVSLERSFDRSLPAPSNPLDRYLRQRLHDPPGVGLGYHDAVTHWQAAALQVRLGHDQRLGGHSPPLKVTATASRYAAPSQGVNDLRLSPMHCLSR